MTSTGNTPQDRARSPHTAATEPARLVIVPGLQTALGGPVLALAGGTSRRPVLTALATFAALAAQGGDEGTA